MFFQNLKCSWNFFGHHHLFLFLSFFAFSSDFGYFLVSAEVSSVVLAFSSFFKSSSYFFSDFPDSDSFFSFLAVIWDGWAPGLSMLWVGKIGLELWCAAGPVCLRPSKSDLMPLKRPCIPPCPCIPWLLWLANGDICTEWVFPSPDSPSPQLSCLSIRSILAFRAFSYLLSCPLSFSTCLSSEWNFSSRTSRLSSFALNSCTYLPISAISR